MWASDYEAHEQRIRGALASVAITVAHIGSTSVPALPTKPIIDVLVTVPDADAQDCSHRGDQGPRPVPQVSVSEWR
ncbi:GrpB family protein [Nocardioides caeni]|uniref:GrpB family protein n=1 Tax=Nocardioides caeni TaxID=574700 RepID=A0A4S8NHC3_9ACTN|nr:GrpB family protein [Nocardioides caeni]